VLGSATAFFNPASSGLTPLTVSEGRLQQANSLRGMSQSAAGLVGLALGGAVVSLAGPGWALAVDAASYGASAVFLALLRLPPHVKLPPQSFLADLHDGWREFVSRTWLWVGVVAASLANLTTGVFAVLGPLIAKESLGGVVAWTEILAGMSVGALLGGFVAMHVRVRRPFFLAMSLISLLALPMALLALRVPAPLVAAGAVVGAGGNMIANTIWETTLQRLVPRAVLSRVTAYDWFGSMACQPIGLAIAGPLAVAIGAGTAMWLAAAGIVLVAVCAAATRSVRRLEV
jgi:Transmembrane secretion effector